MRFDPPPSPPPRPPVAKPQLAAAGTQPLAKDYQAGDPTGRGLILVIDDSPMVLAMVTKTLRAQGFTTVSADGGVKGILTWEKHKDAIRLILSDIFMPGVDGLTLARDLRQRKCVRPIVLMSGKLDDNSRWIAEEAGFHLLQKPFEDKVLLDLMATLIT